MEGRLFALIGVNTGRKREVVQAKNEEAKITWRSFFDGSAAGLITRARSVSAFPTMIVIDHEGVVRHDNLRGEALDRAVETLVKKAEVVNKDDGRPRCSDATFDHRSLHAVDEAIAI
jgi:hypothetical protein